jgi:hypothetical protein
MKFEGSRDIKTLRLLTYELEQRYQAVGEELPSIISRNMADLEDELPLGDKSFQISHILDQLAEAEREIYIFEL